MDENKAYRDELFHVRRSVKYHDHRRRFFENVLNISLFLALICGPSFLLLGMYAGQNADNTTVEVVDWLRYVPVILTSVFTGAALLSGTSSKSNLHNRLKTEFIRLRQEMERCQNREQSQVAEWTAKRLDIEVDEPPINRVVDAICHNEVLQSMGNTDATDYVRVLSWHRLIGPFTRYFDNNLRLYVQGEKGPNWI